MAFSWISVIGGTEITSDQWNEVKTNTDILISNLGVAAYSWSEMPVTQNVSKPDVADTQELRNALDYTHNNNTCSAENAIYDSGNNGVENSAVNNPHHTALHSGDDSNVLDTVQTQYDNNEHYLYDSTDYYSEDANQKTSRYDTRNNTVSDVRLKKDIIYI